MNRHGELALYLIEHYNEVSPEAEAACALLELEARVKELEGWLEERGGCVRCGDSNEWQDGDQGADGLCMPCYADRRETLNRKEEK